MMFKQGSILKKVSDRQREEITNALDSQCLDGSERNLLVAVYPSDKPVS